MTNIHGFDIPSKENSPLTKVEIRRLKKRMLGYGKVKKVQTLSNVPRTTLYDAVNGKNLAPETAAKIRAYLNE